jgi:hypothetical protein
VDIPHEISAAFCRLAFWYYEKLTFITDLQQMLPTTPSGTNTKLKTVSPLFFARQWAALA